MHGKPNFVAFKKYFLITKISFKLKKKIKKLKPLQYILFKLFHYQMDFNCEIQLLEKLYHKNRQTYNFICGINKIFGCHDR